MSRAVLFRGIWLLLLHFAALWGFFPGTVAAQQSPVHVLTVQGVIGPATSDYLIKGLHTASEHGAGLIVIELDTPGGLDPSMRAIVQAILASPVPIATFVSPGGARAASAGTFILYASHIAAMTPASNLGAASPVAIGVGGASDPDQGRAPSRAARSPESARSGSAKSDADSDQAADGERQDRSRRDTSGSDSGDVMAGKVKSDAAAYIRSLAQLRGRNVDFAEHAVLDAKSLSAHEALEQGVIEYVAKDIPSLLVQLDGREVSMSDEDSVTLHTADARVEYDQPGWRVKVLSILTNPQLAVVLMMVGIYGLFFELTSPGFALPGVAGLICLVLGMYAFHLLPVNWAGVALLFVGATMMIAEVFLPSFGVLGIGGVLAFVLGGLFLTDTGIPGFDLSLPFLIGFGVVSALLVLLAGTLATQAHKRRVVTGNEAMLGLEGTVTSANGGLRYAELRGEQWRVVCEDPLVTGDRVKVVGVQGLTLQVIRLDEFPANAGLKKG